MDGWRLTLTLERGGDAVTVGWYGNSGPITAEKLLRDDDLPDSYCESGSLRRLTDAPGSIADVMDGCRAVFALLLRLSGGEPVLWMCSRQHARLYRSLARRVGYKLTVLRGSERKDNPYEPLQHETQFGGSCDEHIVMLER